METQKCRVCGAEYPVDRFPLAGRINGKLYRRRKCQRCYHAVRIAHRRKVRAWFKEFKKTVCCQRCGLQDHRVIDFHHTGEKKYTISLVASSSACSTKSILMELEKCIPLCANCHRILHYETSGA